LEAGIAAKDGVAPSAIDCFEEKHHVSLPAAFKAYLSTVDGMLEGQTDENLVSFLSLESIDQEANVRKVSANEIEMIVAEFSLYSHWYALRTSGSGSPSPVIVTNGNQEKQIATSFEDFLNQYLSSPTKVAYCW
jgi:hypothetical protein